MKYTSINTLSQFPNITYRGKFKMNNRRGIHIKYEPGDVVLYESKTFIANKTVSGILPSIDKNENWYCLAGSAIYIQENVPIDASGGDEWLATNTGKLYRYIEDVSGEQWIEI